MNKLLIPFLMAVSACASGQFKVNYDPAIQPVTDLQYFAPKGGNLFVGDCIPFSKGDTYYLYWLLDSAHHAALDGYGGHQWALSTSKDLKTWKHYPVVLGIDEAWEKSICTGSVVFHNNKFYAFYATRLTKDGKVNEQLSYATSDDGIHFTKQKPNPFYTSAPGYSQRDFRDPKVFVDKDGVFHLLVSSRTETPEVKKWDGSLVHMTSKDLKNWEVKEPLVSGQPSTPECPDYFKWNDWYYVIYSDHSLTYYLKSKGPYGPWEEPATQALIEDWSNVVKTATLGDRRIAAGWVPSRRENKDNGNEAFGGNMVFRELNQLPDGTLTSKFPPEMIPATDAPLKVQFKGGSDLSNVSENGFMIKAPSGVGTARVDNLPSALRITFEVEADGPNEEFGMLLRGSDDGSKGYTLSLSANNQIVQLADTKIYSVEGLDNKTIKIDVIIKDQIIDVDIDNKRCIVNRLIEQQGSSLWFFVKHGNMKFKNIKISPLTKK